jgi:hypothetical protein
MKQTHEFFLTQVAKSKGGDKYEADIGAEKPWVVYVPQKYSRQNVEVAQSFTLTIEID